jgi:hypothetical protein
MSQLVKTKREANFKGFKRFGAFKGLVEQKKGNWVQNNSIFFDSIVNLTKINTIFISARFLGFT